MPVFIQDELREAKSDTMQYLAHGANPAGACVISHLFNNYMYFQVRGRRVGYCQRGYPTSAGGIIVLLKTTTKNR